MEELNYEEIKRKEQASKDHWQAGIIGKILGPWLALGWVTIQVGSGCCSEKYSKITGVEKQGLQ